MAQTTTTDMLDISDLVGETPPPDREISPPVIFLRDEELYFRHSGWIAKRDKVMRLLPLAGTTFRVMQRFANCGAFARVAWSPEKGKHYVRASYCRNRHCVPCMVSKARTIAANIDARLKEKPAGRYRFITLTLRHCDDPLPDQVRRLRQCFTRLCRTRIWKTQAGGCWTWECKIGQDGRWHPHLHLITEGAYLPQAALSDAWQEITRDSHRVDVRRVANREQIGCELTKYIAKGTSTEVWNDDAKAIEWIVASRGMRTCGTFGTWRKFKLTDKPKAASDLVEVDTLFNVIHAARDGAAWAVAIIDELAPGDATYDSS
jgi:hypothetical protein